MIKINKNYIKKFKKFSGAYHYVVAKGIWLTFDIKSLEYVGIDFFYVPYDSKEKERLANELINRLIALDYLEVI